MRFRTMVAVAAAMCLSAPAIAAEPACPTLGESRAAARDLARTGGYSVTDMDGPVARRLEVEQDIPDVVASDHVTILTNRKAGRSIALVAGGKCGGFSGAFAIFTPPLSAIDSARVYLDTGH